MSICTLQRTSSDSSGTFGQLSDEIGRMLCFTVELPWLDNHPQTSCIPNGTYNVINYDSPKHGSVWQIMNVPNRSNIEIHAANTIRDLLGCVGTGDSMGTVDGLPAVMNSVKTLAYLKIVLPEVFKLVIDGVVG